MTRKKVTLAYITNDSERKTSFRKRKRGLIKKVTELSTLCDVDACAIIYSPYEPEPEVWPSWAGARAVLARFQSLSDMDKSKKMVNQESFTRGRIKKGGDQLRRVVKDNTRRDMEIFMFQCVSGIASLANFDLRNAYDLGWVVDQTLSDIQARMDALRNSGLAAPAAVVEEVAPMTGGQNEEVAPLTGGQYEEVAPMTGGQYEEGYLLNHLVESANGPAVDDGLGWDLGMLSSPFFDN